MAKTKETPEYHKVVSNAPIKGLFSMPSKKVQEKKKKGHSIFSKALK